MPLSKLGESLGLAPVSTCNHQAASVHCEGLESDSHSPSFDRSKSAAIAGNEHDEWHLRERNDSSARSPFVQVYDLLPAIRGQCVVDCEQCVEGQDSLAGTTFAPGILCEDGEAIHDGRIAA